MKKKGIKLNSEEAIKEWDKKIKSYSFNGDPGSNYGIYKNWEIDFLLLTKAEFNKLVRLTHNRMKRYNKKVTPKDWAGYTDKDGNKI